ncbi:MAG: aminotransferase class I/II-fold pyridoxal phosphate-dependent enzyme [Acetobacteraceae bacterium]
MQTPPRLAARVTTLKPSATVEMTERVRAARAAGQRIIGLSSGDPGIATDHRIIEAATRAMRDGDTHYGPAQGAAALRAAVAEREQLRTGAVYDPADVLITPGGKFALLTALMGIVQADDEVLVPEPGWVSYGPCVRLCGGVPVALPMLDSIDPARMEAAITKRTVAIILNSPVNPTARVLPASELEAVLALAERHNLWIVFDQVYADLLHAGRFTAPPGQRGRPGAHAGGGQHVQDIRHDRLAPRLAGDAGGTARSFQRFMQHSVYCVPGFVQQAGIAALALFDELVPRYRALFRTRQEYAAGRLAAVPGIACPLPDAGFYLFPAVTGDDKAVSATWLEKLGVASIPGSSFGAAGAGHVRLSLTTSQADLREAMDGIARLAGRKGPSHESPIHDGRRGTAAGAGAAAARRPGAGHAGFGRAGEGARQAARRHQARHPALRLPR